MAILRSVRPYLYGKSSDTGYQFERPSVDSLLEVAQRWPAGEIADNQTAHFSIIPPVGDDRLVCEVGEAYIMRICLVTKKVPAQALNEAVEKQCNDMEASAGRALDKGLRMEINERMRAEMLKVAFPEKKTALVILFPDMLLIEGSGSMAESVILHFRTALGSFPVTPMGKAVKGGAEFSFLDWVLAEQFPAGFSLGDDITVESMDGKFSKFSKGLPVKLVEQLRTFGARAVKSMQIHHEPAHISFVVDANMAPRGIYVGGEAFEQQDEADDHIAFALSTIVITATSVRTALKALSSALSGDKA